MVEHDPDSPQNRNRKISVAIIATIGFWATLCWLGPAYTEAGASITTIFYVFAVLLSVACAIGAYLEINWAFKNSERFRSRFFILIFLLLAWGAHLRSVSVVDEGFAFVSFRILAMCFIAVSGLLFALEVAQIADEAPNPTNKTDTAVAILSFLSAMIPLLISVFRLG